MAAQLQIVVRDMARSEAIEAAIRRKLGRLERMCPRITSFHVTLSMSHHHQHGPRFCVKVDTRLPQVEFTATCDYAEEVHAALGEACQAVRRQLVEHMRKGQGADKTHRRGRQVEREAAGNE